MERTKPNINERLRGLHPTAGIEDMPFHAIQQEKELMSKQATILTNDPSYTHWGWAIINYQGVVIAADCIKSSPENKKKRIRKGDDDTRRISEFNRQLINICKKYNVTYIISELVHGSQNANAMKALGIVTSIGQALADHLNIGIEWYSEADAKKCVVNKRACTKEEMIAAIKKLYKVPWTGFVGKDEHIADALAVHYVASLQSPTLKMMKR